MSNQSPNPGEPKSENSPIPDHEQPNADSDDSFAAQRVAEDAVVSVTQRYQRYLPVIQHVAEQVAFDLEHVKQAVSNEHPAFVTRLVNELLGQGWLVRRDPDKFYCWNPDRGEFCVQRWLDDKLLGSQVKHRPQDERPRERLMRLGPESLRVAELLAILIRSGRPGESAVEAGEKLAKHFQQLEQLPKSGRLELKNISRAIDVTAYCQIMAGIELGRRIAAIHQERIVYKIQSSEDSIRFCQRQFMRLIQDGKQEEFHIVTLDTKKHVIGTHQVTVGTLDASLVHPREVFGLAVRNAASTIILVHNHPSGDPTPSSADINVTERIVQAGKIMGIEVLDHIILGNPTAVSLRANGQM